MRIGSRVRWAVAASAGVHALLVVAGVALTRRLPDDAPRVAARIDTLVTFDAERIPDAREPAPRLTTPDPPPPESEPPTPILEPPPSPPVESDRPLAPRVTAIPSVLPPDLLARVRNHAPASRTDPELRPAAAVEPASVRPAARPAHGALAPGQRVVYLLDASGSMGEWGKFDAARDSVSTTLALQPVTVDAKIVVYSTAADVVTQAALAARTPAGRGDQLAGLRAALTLEPDFVVWFTDADDLPIAAVRTQIRRAGRPVTVVVARVGPDGVSPPLLLR